MSAFVVDLSSPDVMLSQVSTRREIEGLTSGELDLLTDAESDDVAFVWVLTHLGIMEDEHPEDRRPSPAQIDTAFESLDRLLNRGLIRIGRMEWVRWARLKRKPNVRHVAEPLEVVRARVGTAAAGAQKTTDWEFACWVVST